MKKNFIKIALAMLIATMIPLTNISLAKADTEQQTVATVSDGTKVYAPIKSIIEKMGGVVKRYEMISSTYLR